MQVEIAAQAFFLSWLLLPIAVSLPASKKQVLPKEPINYTIPGQGMGDFSTKPDVVEKKKNEISK